MAGLGFVKGDLSLSGCVAFRLREAADSSTGVLNDDETGLGVSSADSRDEVECALFLRLKLDLKESNILFRFDSVFSDLRGEWRLRFLEYVVK